MKWGGRSGQVRSGQAGWRDKGSGVRDEEERLRLGWGWGLGMGLRLRSI